MRSMTILLALVSGAAIAISTPAAAEGLYGPPDTTADEGLASSEYRLPSPPAQKPEEEKRSCETTIYSAAYTAYAFQDIGVLAYDKPVIQTGKSKTCGKTTVDKWNSTALSLKGKYGDSEGSRGYGDEFDLTGTLEDTVQSPFGELEVEVSAAYWLTADFNRVKDDIIQLAAQVGRPIKVGKPSRNGDAPTVTPYIRGFNWVGIDEFPNETFVRLGFGGSAPLGSGFAIKGDLSRVFQLTHEKRKTNRADFELARGFGGGWTGSFFGKFASRMRPVFGLGVSYTR